MRGSLRALGTGVVALAVGLSIGLGVITVTTIARLPFQHPHGALLPVRFADRK